MTSSKTYGLVDVFHTIQGEGHYAGKAALFIRFAGCNMWSGNDKTRQDDARLNGARCPVWCDTDFMVRFKETKEQIAMRARTAARGSKIKLVVFSGGEPLLQLDPELVDEIHNAFDWPVIAVETNGSIRPTRALRETGLWFTCSPKVAPQFVALEVCHELKVVYPAYDPLAYEQVLIADHLYVQPQAAVASRGVSSLLVDNQMAAAEFVMRNPHWRLSLQTHKVLGLP